MAARQGSVNVAVPAVKSPLGDWLHRARSATVEGEHLDTRSGAGMRRFGDDLRNCAVPVRQRQGTGASTRDYPGRHRCGPALRPVPELLSIDGRRLPGAGRARPHRREKGARARRCRARPYQRGTRRRDLGRRAPCPPDGSRRRGPHQRTRVLRSQSGGRPHRGELRRSDRDPHPGDRQAASTSRLGENRRHRRERSLGLHRSPSRAPRRRIEATRAHRCAPSTADPPVG